MSRFRGRDATAFSASLHVTDDAHAKIIDTNTFRLFEFGHQDRPKFPERPSTSGGIKKSTGNFPKRANTVKRETRDDLFFNPLTAHGKDGPTFYNFPLPSVRPPPSPVVAQMVEPLLRPYSPGSIKTSMTVHPNVGEAAIGMALGSPAHPPENMQQAQQSFGVETIRILHPMDDVSHYADSVVAPKQKKGRKWFGLFGSRKEKTPTSFYQLKPESQQEFPTSDPSSPEVKRTGRSRGRSASGKTSKKPNMKRAQTAPTTPSFQHSFQASTSTNIRAGTPDIRVQGPIGVEVLRSYPKVSSEGPKLDLALPSVQMERYSVMFGDILQKPSTNTSSLLQRRQATLDRLKSVEEALATKEAEIEARTKALTRRRATSPQPNHNSPSFSLFPNTPSRQGNRASSPSREKSSLHRSNTSPAGLSPARASFAPGFDNNTHADLVFDNKTPTNRSGHEHKDFSPTTSTKKPRKQSAKSSSSFPRPQPQIQTTRTWSPNKSQLLSPSSAEESEADARSTNGQEKEDSYNASQLTATKSNFEKKESTWQTGNSKKQNHGTPSSVSGSMTSETGTISSSHSTTSFASAPGSIYTNVVSLPEQEKMREKDSRKTSPTSFQSPQKAQDIKIPIKSTPGPRPIISTFNITTWSAGSAPRPIRILKSPVSENQSPPASSSRPLMQDPFSNASLASGLSPRPSLQKSPMTSANLSSTNISSPRKIPLPASPHPQRSIETTISSPHPEPTYNFHQKQASTSSITPSLLDVHIDETPINPSRSRSRDAEQKRLESAAGVSIARQISVSRQQRQLLIPIQTSNGTISKRNPRGRSPGITSPSDRQSEQSSISAGSGVGSGVGKRFVTGENVIGKNSKGSPLESVTELSLRGGILLSSVTGHTGGDVRGMGILNPGTRGDITIKSSRSLTPTLVLVPDVDEWSAGSSGGINGSNSNREKVEAMMKGTTSTRGNPEMVLGNGGSEWEEKGGNTLNVNMNKSQGARTEMGSGYVNRRSERGVVMEA
ncbi:hypothetical protein SBOR_5402 [Sclerotinia borealis F-4128]|uniref:Uncharacterized protein n=1 Tax=Sclerotinia borealis (strain F-4128) TaxID=1432307 RepID=W9CBS7_SCLBF|nr:hypothetical protein SBOR_5402 [Sclerotinia borealis F-4128]